MRTEELDRRLRESLSEEAGRARFDPDAWRPTATDGNRRRGFARTAPRSAFAALAAAVVAAAIAIPLVLLSPLRPGPAEDPPPTRTLGSPSDLWGTRFRATSVRDAGEASTVVATMRLDISFSHRRVVSGPNTDPVPDRPDRGMIGWSVGCNSHGAGLRITPRRLLIADSGVSTLIRCLGREREQEGWAQRFLASDPYWTLEGDTLTLTSGDAVIELRRRGGSSETETATTETTTHADADDGISIEIPSDWTFHQDPSGPPEPNTRTLFAVGSWAFPRGGECAPTEALSALPADGVLFWINEVDPERSAIDVVPRPERFDLDDAPFAPSGCALVPFRYQWFGENGRSLQINVAYGEDASLAMQDLVLRALDSMVVTAPVPDGCPADMGPWADPDCPAQAWVRAVVRDAGFEVTRDTGSALVAVADGTRFYIHSTPARPDRDVELAPEETESFAQTVRGYGPPVTLDRTEVYVHEGSAVWEAQGFHLWISPYLFDGLPTSALERLVRSSKAVDYDAIDTR